MRQITEVLRLKYEAGLSHERIARACGLSKGVVGKYVSLAQVQGVTWPLPKDLDEVRLTAPAFCKVVVASAVFFMPLFSVSVAPSLG
jgi:hypothetical protein